MRYVLIGLGVLTMVLAAVLAWERLWWIAVPDAAFGAGIAWVAWVSLREDRRPRLATPAPEPGLAVAPLPPELPRTVAPVPTAPIPPAAVAPPRPAAHRAAKSRAQRRHAKRR